MGLNRFAVSLSRAALGAVGLLAVGVGSASADTVMASKFYGSPSSVGSFDYATGGGESDWSLSLGGGFLVYPKYQGSDEVDILPLPFFFATYQDWLRLSPLGLDVDIVRWEGLTLTGKAGWEFGRSEDDSDDLNGLGDIDFGGTLGLEAKYRYGPAAVFAGFKQTIGGSEGLTGNVGASLGYRFAPNFGVTGKVATIFADNDYMDAYFGVNRVQSVRSGLAVYDPGAGLKEVEMSLTANYGITENWFVRAETKLGILTGDAADSPIVKQELQPTFSAFISYRF
ncbi:MAG: MipA/OmpV family protein [Rhodospirillaceae bacterium]